MVGWWLAGSMVGWWLSPPSEQAAVVDARRCSHPARQVGLLLRPVPPMAQHGDHPARHPDVQPLPQADLTPLSAQPAA